MRRLLDESHNIFIRVELDGKTLDEKNYTVKEGSTIVTLNADYVATLSAGKNTVGIVSESGTATTTFTVAEKVAATARNCTKQFYFAEPEEKKSILDSLKDFIAKCRAPERNRTVKECDRWEK